MTIVKGAGGGGKPVTYKGNPIRLLDFSAETLQARRERNEYLKY